LGGVTIVVLGAGAGGSLLLNEQPANAADRARIIIARRIRYFLRCGTSVSYHCLSPEPAVVGSQVRVCAQAASSRAGHGFAPQPMVVPKKNNVLTIQGLNRPTPC
jgi:hypothetical protein